MICLYSFWKKYNRINNHTVFYVEYTRINKTANRFVQYFCDVMLQCKFWNCTIKWYYGIRPFNHGKKTGTSDWTLKKGQMYSLAALLATKIMLFFTSHWKKLSTVVVGWLYIDGFPAHQSAGVQILQIIWMISSRARQNLHRTCSQESPGSFCFWCQVSWSILLSPGL